MDPLKINPEEIPVDEKTKKAEIDASENGQVYVAINEHVFAYPLPFFGTITIDCRNGTAQRPEYSIKAEK